MSGFVPFHPPAPAPGKGSLGLQRSSPGHHLGIPEPSNELALQRNIENIYAQTCVRMRI